MTRSKYPVEGGGRSSRARELFIQRGGSEEARWREAHFYDLRLKPYMNKHHCSVEKALDHVQEVRRKIAEYEECTDEEYVERMEAEYERWRDEDVEGSE